MLLFVFFFFFCLIPVHFPFFNDHVQKLKIIFRTIIFHEYIQLMNPPIFQNNKQETGELQLLTSLNPMIPNASSLASIVKYATDGDTVIPFPTLTARSTENVSFPSGTASFTIVKTQDPEFWFGLNSTTCERPSTSSTAEAFI